VSQASAAVRLGVIDGSVAALSDGTRAVITTHARPATFSRLFGDTGGTITVRAVGDGLNTATGPAAHAMLKPLFGRIRPVRRRGH